MSEPLRLPRHEPGCYVNGERVGEVAGWQFEVDGETQAEGQTGHVHLLPPEGWDDEPSS